MKRHFFVFYIYGRETLDPCGTSLDLARRAPMLREEREIRLSHYEPIGPLKHVSVRTGSTRAPAAKVPLRPGCRGGLRVHEEGARNRAQRRRQGTLSGSPHEESSRTERSFRHGNRKKVGIQMKPEV